MVNVPSPAIAIVGRHNSGKTTISVKLIAELTRRGFDVGSIKHHSHGDFDIDYPGKDSYRQREAGATETVIASPHKMARIKTLQSEVECAQIVQSMPGHDIVIVEGYRKSGLPTIEIMRSGNEADSAVAKVFAEGAKSGIGLGCDDVQEAKRRRGGDDHDNRDLERHEADLKEKMPVANTVAIISDISEACEAAQIYGIPCFGLEDVNGITDFLVEHFTRQRVSVVIQAGGESKRMGQSKALVQFKGRPLICRLIERLEPAADELIITTNEADKLQFVYEMYPHLDITLKSDKHDFRGALPGMHSALEAAKYPFVALVACDMVFASASLVVAETIEMAETNADVVVPVNNHGYEPFHATYRKATCLPAVERAIEEGQLRAQAIFDDPNVKVQEFPQYRVLQVEPRGGCFINTNTPEELAHIEKSYLGE